MENFRESPAWEHAQRGPLELSSKVDTLQRIRHTKDIFVVGSIPCLDLLVRARTGSGFVNNPHRRITADKGFLVFGPEGE